MPAALCGFFGGNMNKCLLIRDREPTMDQSHSTATGHRDDPGFTVVPSRNTDEDFDAEAWATHQWP